MFTLRYTDPSFRASVANLQRQAVPSPHVEETVKAIIGRVREEGDGALSHYTAYFGGPALTADEFRVSDIPPVNAEVQASIAAARRNVRAFAERSLRKNWTMVNEQGASVGERFDPFQRVGIYVPGGTAPLISTAVMTVTLAAAAGVPEIVVTTPCDAAGRVNEALLHALAACGANEIYRIGGAQAIAALAYGTGAVRPVQKIFGPGNAYVVEAKRQVFGQVAIDLLPGPSEILVLADGSANAAWIASDLLAQAEHGSGSSIILITDSSPLLLEVEAELKVQTATLHRQAALAEVLEKNCVLILVKSLLDGVQIANEFAPEHLSIVTASNAEIASLITSAGAIFTGAYSPVAAGDFLAGPSHTLPTGGAGKSFSGLTADMFQRRTSLIELDESALRKSVPIIGKFAELEGLDAHGRSAAIRFELTSAEKR